MLDGTEVPLDRCCRALDLLRIRHVANITLCSRHFALQPGEALAIPGQQRHAITSFAEASGES